MRILELGHLDYTTVRSPFLLHQMGVMSFDQIHMFLFCNVYREELAGLQQCAQITHGIYVLCEVTVVQDAWI